MFLSIAIYPGLLGSFLWYRLCQRRFRKGYVGQIGHKSPHFTRPKPDSLSTKSSFTAVPGRQHTCLPFALVAGGGQVHVYDVCLPGAPPVAAVTWNSAGTLLVALDGVGAVRVWHRIMGTDE